MKALDVFGDEKSYLVNFNDCEQVDLVLGGAMNKITILYKGELFILKFDKKGSTATISEYIASLLARDLQLDCQQVLLGTYHGNRCCALKYFLNSGELLHAYREINDSSLNSGFARSTSDTRYDLPTIINTIKEYKNLDIPTSYRLKFFQNMCFFDTIIGNFDRHWGNWGFIGSSKNYRLAPLFDNGSSLFPQRQSTGVLNILYSEEEMLKRVYNFPTSALKKGSDKYNYKELVLELVTIFDTDVLNEFCAKFELIDIGNTLAKDKVLREVLTKDDLLFISRIVNLRYNLLLKEVLVNARISV